MIYVRPSRDDGIHMKAKGQRQVFTFAIILNSQDWWCILAFITHMVPILHSDVVLLQEASGTGTARNKLGISKALKQK